MNLQASTTKEVGRVEKSFSDQVYQESRSWNCRFECPIGVYFSSNRGESGDSIKIEPVVNSLGEQPST